MKRIRTTFTELKLAAVMALLAGAGLVGGCGKKPAPPAPPATAAKASAAATNAVPVVSTNVAAADTVSFFEIIPCKGVDPFYPGSTRLCEGETNHIDGGGTPPPVQYPLKVNAMNISPRSTLVNINGKSFASGEMGRVQIPPPPEPMTKMVRIQVLEIQKNRVQIKAEGELGPRWLPWKP